MSQVRNREPLYPAVSMLPKDVGVGIVVLVALLLGWLLYHQVNDRMTIFQEQNSPFQLTYPATWSSASSLQDVLFKVEDPLTDSIFKTALTVERRDLDPATPPTLQTLIDRRVSDHGALTGYHFLADHDATVGGVKAEQLEYAYVVQPLDTPRRASLPVVVHAREYIVIAKDRSYYITLAAPENEFVDASAQLDTILKTVQVQ